MQDRVRWVFKVYGVGGLEEVSWETRGWGGGGGYL